MNKFYACATTFDIVIWYTRTHSFFFYETVSQNRQVLILDCCKFQQMPSTAPQFSSHQKLLPRQRLKWSNRHQPQQKPRNMPSFWTKDPPTQQRNLAHSSAKWCPTLLVCCLTKVKKGNEGWNIIGYCNIGWAEVGENNLWVSRYFSTHFSKDWSDQLDRYCRSARKHKQSNQHWCCPGGTATTAAAATAAAAATTNCPTNTSTTNCAAGQLVLQPLRLCNFH